MVSLAMHPLRARMSRLSVARRLALGTALILGILLLYGVYATNRIENLARQTAKMHEHPLEVQRAVLEAKLAYVKIHRAMKDIALSEDEDAILAWVREVEEHEKIVHRSFEILEDRFLGERAAVDAAFEAFLDWSPIRAEVIALQLRGESEAARDITQGSGAAHEAMLEARLGELGAFAEAKASAFRSRSRALREETIHTTRVLLVGLVLLAGLVAWATARGITVPLESLTDAADRIRRGEFDHRAEVTAQNELGTLARSFNSMVDDLGAQTRTIEKQRDENQELLLNILPEPIADRLKSGETPIADSFGGVSVVFADLVGFTPYAASKPANQVVEILGRIFTEFDETAEELGLEKIKTIGDAYMAVAGLPIRSEGHAGAAARFGLAMLDIIRRFNADHGTGFDVRVGINSGPVVAGVIGKHKFVYDLWGDTVNVASRMESHGVPGTVHISKTTWDNLQFEGGFEAEERGEIEIKGRGSMPTYLLKSEVA
jgi:class 3 adenylate cyclase